MLYVLLIICYILGTVTSIILLIPFILLLLNLCMTIHVIISIVKEMNIIKYIRSNVHTENKEKRKKM